MRDELGHTVAVTADRATATATAAAPAVLHLTGVFTAGDAGITWTVGGHALATWDFQVELD